MAFRKILVKFGEFTMTTPQPFMFHIVEEIIDAMQPKRKKLWEISPNKINSHRGQTFPPWKLFDEYYKHDNKLIVVLFDC